MKKFMRFPYIFVLIIVATVLAAVLCACSSLANDGGNKGDKDEHAHTFAEVWESEYEGHYHAATCGHDVKGDYAEHDFEDEPRVTNDTGEFYTCKVCGHEYPFSHEYGEPELIKAAELCTEESHYLLKCKKCGHEREYTTTSKHDYTDWEAVSDDVHMRTCKLCNYEDSHTPNPINGGEFIQGCTCTQSGIREAYCTTCRLDMYVTVPALGHSWTYKSQGEKYHSLLCTRCGERDIEAHTIEEATEKDGLFHYARCEDCYDRRTMPHDFSDGDCVCGLSYVPFDGLTYAQTDGGLNVVGIGSFSGEYLYIPAEHEGKAVVGIAAGAFSGATALKSVYVPDSVTVIGEGAFSGCNSLISMRLPFIGAQKREKTELHQYPIGYIFGEGDSSGSAQAFYDDSLTETTQKYYAVPNSLESVSVSGGAILYGALRGTRINTVFLESGVTAIENNAFRTFNLNLSISDTVTSIADGALIDINFTSLYVDENNPHYRTIDNCFIDITGKTLLLALPGCVIPEDGIVTKIAPRAFYNGTLNVLSTAYSVVIPSSVTYIGDESFYKAKATVTIDSDKLTYIGKNAFRDCNRVYGFTVDVDSDVFIGEFALTQISGTVNISCANIVIEDTAFNWSGITEFTLKCGNATFGNRVFSYCKSLLTMNINCDEVTLGNGFAEECKLLDSVEIAGLAEFGSDPFYGCYDLYRVTLSGEFTKLPQSAFKGCAKLSRVTLPSNLTEIGAFAFSGCSSLKSIEIPSSVSSIGSNVFEKCSALSELKIPFLPSGKLGPLFSTAIYTNSYSASQGYGQLFYIPKPLKKVTVLGGNLFGAFMNCTSLTEINLGANGSFSGRISSDSFSGVSITALDVPDGLQLSDKADFGGMDKLTSVVWRLNTEVTGPYFKNCPNLETLTVASGVTSIMPSAFYGLSGLEKVVLPDSVTSIGQYAFGGSALTSLSIPKLDGTLGNLFATKRESKSVAVTQDTASGEIVYYIPSTLTSVTVGGNNIPQGAFMNCTLLKSVTCTGENIELGDKAFFNCGITQYIAPSVYKVGQAAFQNCEQVTKIELGNLTEINAYAFKNCYKLATLVAGMPTGMTVIPSGLFDGCSAITAFDIPSTVDTIGERAFAGTAIVGIVLPLNITAINAETFDGCANLSTIDIPAGVSSIGNGAFNDCTSLTAIEIPASVSSIGNSAFCGCTALGTVVASGSIASLGNYAFKGCSSLTTATLPGSYTALNSGLFDGCEKLSELTIAPNVGEVKSRALGFCGKLNAFDFSKLTDIDDEAFIGCSSLTTVTLPSTLITIGKAAFSGCVGVTTVKLYSALATSAATQAEPIFFDCPALSTVEIGGEVSAIPAYMFTGCNGIKSVALTSATITKIGEGAFMNTGLTALALGGLADGITIARRAFYGCADVEAFTMPSGNFTIGEEAFFGMNKPTELVIEFGSNATVGEGAFGGWSALVNITTNNARSGKSSADFFGYMFGKTEYEGGTAHAQFKDHEGDPTVYYIPDTLKNVTVTGGTLTSGTFSGLSGISKVVIGEAIGNPFQAYLFSGCSSLKTVTFQGNYSAVSIPEYMFEGCMLTSFALFEKVVQVGEGAFAGNRITSAVMCPNGYSAQTVTIGEGAFENCPALTSFTVRGTANTEIGQSAFAGCSELKTFASECTNNAVVGISAFGDCSALTAFDMSDSEQITLSDYALKNCSALSAIDLGNVTSIGLGALSGCTGITELELNFVGNGASFASQSQRTMAHMYGKLPYEGGVETVIDSTSYYIPQALKKITLTQGKVFAFSFKGCVGVTEINVPAMSGEIPQSAFQDCEALSSVELSSATSIGYNSFNGCKALKSVELDSITSVGYDAFVGCTSLRTVTLGGNLRTIYSRAFKDCSFLSQITIPKLVNTIGAEAFAGCTMLQSVTFEKTTGWDCIMSSTPGDRTPLTAGQLTPSSAAKLLTSTYKDYSWSNTSIKNAV